MTGVAGAELDLALAVDRDGAAGPTATRRGSPARRARSLGHLDRGDDARARPGRAPVRGAGSAGGRRRRAGRCGRPGAAARRCWTGRSRAARRRCSTARAASRAATAPSRPTCATVVTHTSTSAISRVGPALTCSTFAAVGDVVGGDARRWRAGRRRCRRRWPPTSPGNALLVPVDRGSSGTSPLSAAAARTVPSPPSTTITPAPRARIAATSARVSSAVPVSALSSTNSSAGRRPALARRFARPRATPPATPMPSVEIRARSTPAAPAAASSRSTMLVFSALGNTEACATRRRMSRPDIGLATIPTVEPGDDRKLCARDRAHRAQSIARRCPRTRVAAVLQAPGQAPASARTAGAVDAATNGLVARSGSTTSTSGASR